MAIAITRTDLTSRELHAASSRSHDARAARRMVAVALVPERPDRKSAASSCGIGSIATTRKVLRGLPGAAGA